MVLKCDSATKMKLSLEKKIVTNLIAMLQFVHHYHSNTIVDLIGQEREDKYIVSRRVHKFRHLDFRVLTTVCEISEFIPQRTLGSELPLVSLQGYKTWKWKDGGR
jgi:hypothetical protein